MTELMKHDRRAFLKGSVVGAASLLPLAGVAAGDKGDASAADAADIDRVTTGAATIKVDGGHISGYRRDGVNIFKGLPYAGAPTGEYRFRRAPAVEPWEGVRPYLNYGPICPTGRSGSVDLSTTEWVFLLPSGQYTTPMEDCLRINIWAPDTGPDEALPVMLWLHADGFGGGSSQKYLSSDGENLARSEHVIVASINHRVGPLGFFNLAEIGGERYAQSANVGMLDIIDALKWVSRNINGFGGDPDNVTLFGQSGGGFKISTLLAMPESRGLFHKAIIQSGARLRVHDRGASAHMAREMAALLEIETAMLTEQLADLPSEKFFELVWQSAAAVGEKNVEIPEWAFSAAWFEPTAGFPELPLQPGDPQSFSAGLDIPLMIGSAREEICPAVADPTVEDLSWGELSARLKEQQGPNGESLKDAVLADFPFMTPADVLAVLSSRSFRMQADKLAGVYQSASSSDVFQYLFTWRTEVMEGRPRAYHMADVAFAFANSDLLDQQTGGGARARRLADNMSRAWANFARTGKPFAPGMPEWEPFDPDRRNLMVLDDECRMEDHFDRNTLRAWDSARSQQRD